MALDFSGQPFAARTLVTLVSFHLVLQLAGRIQMIGLVDAPIQQIDTPLRGPRLDISGGSNFGSVQLQLPQAHHQHPFQGPQLAFLEDRTRPVREHGTLLAQARGAGHTAEALQTIVTPFACRDRSAATAWTRDAIGPAQVSQIGLNPTLKP